MQPPLQTAGWLYTRSNKIYQPDGQVWVGRGANIHDTRGCNACTYSEPDLSEVLRRIDELVDAWGATFVRLCLESYASAAGRVHWQGLRQDPQYFRDVQRIVDHVGQKPGVYLLLTIWEDPSLDADGWPTSKTRKIWKKLVKTFGNDSHVLFGVATEPKANFDGAKDPAAWRAMNSTVKTIRAIEKRRGFPSHLIAVQGTGGWARRLDYYVTHPIRAGGGDNVVYEVHVYDPPSNWSNQFEVPAETLPVIIGEYGPASGFMTLAETKQMARRASELEIPHLGWTLHMRCPPNLLVDHSGGTCGIGMPLEPTAWGRWLRRYLGGSSPNP